MYLSFLQMTRNCRPTSTSSCVSRRVLVDRTADKCRLCSHWRPCVARYWVDRPSKSRSLPVLAETDRLRRRAVLLPAPSGHRKNYHLRLSMWRRQVKYILSGFQRNDDDLMRKRNSIYWYGNSITLHGFRVLNSIYNWIFIITNSRDALASWGYSDRRLCCNGYYPSTSVICINEDSNWPVYFLLLPFHDLRCRPLCNDSYVLFPFYLYYDFHQNAILFPPILLLVFTTPVSIVLKSLNYFHSWFLLWLLFSHSQQISLYF